MYVKPSSFNILHTKPLNPHRGCSGTPFIKTTTLLFEISYVFFVWMFWDCVQWWSRFSSVTFSMKSKIFFWFSSVAVLCFGLKSSWESSSTEKFLFCENRFVLKVVDEEKTVLVVNERAFKLLVGFMVCVILGVIHCNVSRKNKVWRI